VVCTRPGCGSTFLDRERPRGKRQRGMIWCSKCARTLCWVALPVARPPATADPLGEPLVVRRPIKAVLMERTSGCGRTCSVTFGHDARAHETFGRDAALAALKAARTGVVRTGPLVIDFDARRVAVDGDELLLSGRERGVLEHLAARVGRACGHAEIVAAVWNVTTADLWAWQSDGQKRWHYLRVVVARTRAKLGPASALITTIPMIGLRLEAVAPTAALEAHDGD
jgi:DNA-binding winged helix-turn-helix (wHTH) protein